MVVRQPSKLVTRVRFPSPALNRFLPLRKGFSEAEVRLSDDERGNLRFPLVERPGSLY